MADCASSRLNRDESAQCVFVRTDVSRESDVRKLMTSAARRFGRIDVLINNAAVLSPAKAVHETTFAEFEAAVDANLRGTFLASKYAYAHLKRSRGCIVNVSSMAGVIGEKDHAAYAATKGGINALTKSMAIDYGREGIRVNAVCPGGVSTANADKVIRSGPNAKRLLRQRDSLHGLSRTAAPEEVAAVVHFLASRAASFVSGALIPVSGALECGYGIKY